MRVEIVLRFEELADGSTKEDVVGTEFSAMSNGMEKMTTLGPHECMAYALAFVHEFHSQIAARQKAQQGPKIEMARAVGHG